VGHGSDNDVNSITASCKRRREDAAVEGFIFPSPSKQPTLSNLFTVSSNVTPFILSNKNPVENASVKSALPSIVGKNSNNQHDSVSFTPNVGSKNEFDGYKTVTSKGKKINYEPDLEGGSSVGVRQTERSMPKAAPSAQHLPHSSGRNKKNNDAQSLKSRSRGFKPLVVGRSTGVVMAMPRYVEFYAGRWLITSDDNLVKEYIEKNIGVVQSFALIKSNHSRFKSYRFAVEDLLVSKVKNPDNWPRNIIINKYFAGKKQTEPTQTAQNGSSEAKLNVKAVDQVGEHIRDDEHTLMDVYVVENKELETASSNVNNS
jgi:hypothetical protein